MRSLLQVSALVWALTPSAMLRGFGIGLSPSASLGVTPDKRLNVDKLKAGSGRQASADAAELELKLRMVSEVGEHSSPMPTSSPRAKPATRSSPK